MAKAPNWVSGPSLGHVLVCIFQAHIAETSELCALCVKTEAESVSKDRV